MGIFQRIIHDWPGRVPDAVYGAGRLGVVPTWLNELVPANARAVLPGFVYQLGNLLASVNATLQARIAETHGGNYGLAMAIVAGAVAILICVFVAFGRETRGVVISGTDSDALPESAVGHRT